MLVPRNKFISVIIPVHNEETRLATCLEKIIPYLAKRHSHEIIIVDNGSTDATWEICKIYTTTYQHVHALHLDERGKGLAVKRGMEFAQGKYRYMCDVDLSTPIYELDNFLRMGQRHDVVIGSRELTASLVHTTLLRRIVGRAFHLLVNDLVPGVRDTQCGFKLFRDVAARAIFGRMQLTSMAFDVEALYIARMLGYTIGEIPIHWTHNPDSRVRMWSDSLEMARDVISIPWMHTQAKIPA